MVKTQCFLETWQSKPKKYVLDTCIGRRCYDNYAYCDMLKTKVSDLPTSTVVFTSVSVYEIDKRVECGFGELYLQLKSDINSEITIQKITYNMKSWEYGCVTTYQDYILPIMKSLHMQCLRIPC